MDEIKVRPKEAKILLLSKLEGRQEVVKRPKPVKFSNSVISDSNDTSLRLPDELKSRTLALHLVIFMSNNRNPTVAQLAIIQIYCM